MLTVMKEQFSKHIGVFCPLCSVLLAVAPQASAQPRPSLGLRFSVGQPTLSLTGEVGTVYSIQYATGLSATNVWVERTLLEAQGASNDWRDPSSPTPGQRFYRAVSVPEPTATNRAF